MKRSTIRKTEQGKLDFIQKVLRKNYPRFRR